jgi:hypothetical protein
MSSEAAFVWLFCVVSIGETTMKYPKYPSSKKGLDAYWRKVMAICKTEDFLYVKPSYVSPAHKAPALPVRFVRKQPA